MTGHRAAFDASITFGNGGDLTVHDFRVDVPSPDVTEDEIAALFVASLGLLMTDAVHLSNVRVFPEPHKGTRGGPSDRPATPTGRARILPLDTPATRLTLPPRPGTSPHEPAPTEARGGTPRPETGTDALPSADPARSGATYGDATRGTSGGVACGDLGGGAVHGAAPGGTEGSVACGEVAGEAGGDAPCGDAAGGDVVDEVVGGVAADDAAEAAAGGVVLGNRVDAEPVTGRAGFPAGSYGSRTEAVAAESPGESGAAADAGLDRTVELPAVVVRASGASWETIGVGALAPFAVRGHAVLLQTQAGESLTEAAARWLVSQDAALVATDAPTLGRSREILLEAGIPVAESLTGLHAIPPTGAFFTVVPPRAVSGPTLARAYARVS